MGYTPAVGIGASQIARQPSPLNACDSQQEHFVDDDSDRLASYERYAPIVTFMIKDALSPNPSE